MDSDVRLKREEPLRQLLVNNQFKKGTVGVLWPLLFHFFSPCYPPLHSLFGLASFPSGPYL